MLFEKKTYEIEVPPSQGMAFQDFIKDRFSFEIRKGKIEMTSTTSLETYNKDLYNDLHPYTEDLKSIFIVSQAFLIKEESLAGTYESNDIEGLSVLIEPATGEKCERCWMHDTSVGTSPQHPAICNRCEENIKGL